MQLYWICCLLIRHKLLGFQCLNDIYNFKTLIPVPTLLKSVVRLYIIFYYWFYATIILPLYLLIFTAANISLSYYGAYSKMQRGQIFYQFTRNLWVASLQPAQQLMAKAWCFAVWLYRRGEQMGPGPAIALELVYLCGTDWLRAVSKGR